MTLDVVAGMLAKLAHDVGVVDHALHDALEVGGAAYLDAATARLETLCLLEALVVGPEDDGDVPDGSLEGVVDAYAEAATDIGDVGIAVDAGEQSEAVDEEHVGIADVVGCRLSIAHDLTTRELLLDGSEVVGIDDVGCDDGFPVGVVVEPGDEDVLVGLPAAAGDEAGAVGLELVDEG